MLPSVLHVLVVIGLLLLFIIATSLLSVEEGRAESQKLAQGVPASLAGRKGWIMRVPHDLKGSKQSSKLSTSSLFPNSPSHGPLPGLLSSEAGEGCPGHHPETS